MTVYANSRLTGVARQLKSTLRTIAFFGDSITQQAGQTFLYGFRISSTVNGFTSTNWAILGCDPETPAGSGSWVYNSATGTMTWAAPGESAGTAVDATKTGILYLPSSNANHGITVAWDGANTAYASGTTTVTVPADGNQYQAVYCSRGYPVTTLAQLGMGWGVARTSVYHYGMAIGGVPGFGSAALLSARWQTDAVFADVDIIEIGTNDIAASVSASTIIANLTAIIQGRIGVGTPYIGVMTIPPRDSQSATHRKTRAQVNAWIRDYCAANDRLHCLDINAAIEDPGSSGNWLSGYSGDGIHPSNIGAWAIGKVAATWIATLSSYKPAYPSFYDIYDATYNPYGTLAAGTGYTSFEGTSGTAGAGASGTVPANFTLARNTGAAITAVGSKVARTDNVGGNWYQVVLASAVADEYFHLIQQSNPLTLSSYGLSAGDSIEGFLEVNIPSSSSLKFLDLRLSWGGVAAGSRNMLAFNDAIVGGNAVLQDSMGLIYIRIPPATIPVGATSVNITIRMGTAASGSATIQLGRWRVNKVRSV